MEETVNFLIHSHKLSKIQKLILLELFESKEKGYEYSILSDTIAKLTNNIIIKKKFYEIKNQMFQELKKNLFNGPEDEDKNKMLIELFKIDLILLDDNMRKNKWAFKKYKLNPSFKASFSRTIKRLENRKLIKTYNYYIPYYYCREDHALKENYNDKDYNKLYCKYIELSKIGIDVCKYIFTNEHS